MTHYTARTAGCRPCFLAGTIAAFLASILHLQAANTWDGGAANGNWSSLLNWDNDQLPAFATGVTFAGLANLSTTNDLNNLTLGGITFDPTAGSFALTGNAISLSGNIINNALIEQTINLPIALLAPATVNVAEFGTLTIAPGSGGTGAISGGFDLFKSGAGTLVLGATNTYTGNTVLDGGTLRFTASNSVNALTFGATIASPNVSRLELVGADLTAASLRVQTNSLSPNTIAIDAGRTLTVNGAFTAGANVAGLNQPDVDTLTTISGGGSLVVNGGVNHFSVGMPRSNGDVNPDPSSILDLSGLSNFTYTATTGELRVGGGNVAGTLHLANTSNVVTAAQVRIGDSGVQAPAPDNGNNNGGTSNLTLGPGTNVFNVNTIIVGAVKSPAMFTFQGANGSITIGGLAGGASTTNITVGNASSATATNTISQFQLAGHMANIRAGNLTIGQLAGSSGGAGNGNVTFDTGTFDVNNLVLGTHSTGTAANGANGTFELGGSFPNPAATGVLNVHNQFLLLNRTIVTGTVATGTFTINGGTANINADILIVDNSTNAAPRTTTLTLASGTLNMMGHAIATAALPINNVNFPTFGQTATLANLGGTGINGVGLTMNGGGTLILEGTTSYTGPTTISLSTLQVGTGGNSGFLGNGPVTNDGILLINRTGTLPIPGDITGTGSVQINGGATVALGGVSTYAGPTDVNGGVLAVTGSLTSAVNVNAGGALAGSGDGVTTGRVGNVTLAAGASIRPGPTGLGGDAGTLSMSGLVVNGGDLHFDLGATNDLISVSGTANFTAASNLIPNPAAPSGTYTLLSAGTLTLGVTPTLVAPIGTRKTFSADFATPNAIKLIVSGASKSLNWTGATNSAWDLGAAGTQNWNDGAVNESFFQADSVTFGDGPTNRTVTITGITVQPASVVVNNSLGNDYSIGGTGAIGGTASVVKNGAGALSLGTANTYTGGTVLTAGTLNINHPSALSTGALIIEGGALDNTSGGPVTVTTSTPQSWNADFAFVGTHPLNTGAGPITLGADRTVTIGAGTLTVGGPIQGSFGLTKAGAGTLVLTGANLHGSTTIAAGTLQVGDGGTSGSLGGGTVNNSAKLVFNRSDQFTVSNVLDGAGEFMKAGAGILLLAGANTYGGPTIISAGTLRVTNAGAGVSSLGALAGGTVTVAPGAALDLSGNLTAQALNFGAKEFRIAGTGPDGLGAIVNYGVSQFNAFQQMVLTGNATVGGAQRFDIRSVPTSERNARLDLAGNTLTKSGTNQFSLVGVDVTDGDIVINQGVFALETVTAIPDFGTGKTITMNAGTTLQFFNATASPSTVMRPIVFNGQGSQIGNANNNANSIVGSPILLNGDLTVSALNNTNATSGLTIAGPITETGVRSITKNGLSLLVLAGNNSYSGGTTINGGTVQMQSATALGAPTAPLTVNTGGTLDLFANSLTVGAFSGSNGTITSTTAGPVVFTAGGAADTTFGGIIQDGSASINFIKQGTGTLTLTGVHAYTGVTNVNAGGLEVNGSISGAVVVNGGVLGGIGTVGALSLSQGAIAPGGSAGILNTGNLALDGGNLAVEIAGPFAGAGLGFHDQVNVVGTVSLGGPVTLTLDFSGYDPLDTIDSFILVNNDDVDAISLASVNARFFFGATRLDEGTTFTATSGAFMQTFSITYVGGTSGNDVVLHALETIPEPGTMMAILGGMGVLALSRQRHRHSV